MKRIYMTLGLLAALGTSALAQGSVDLEAVIQFPLDGANISTGQSLDTSDVLCGIFYNGDDIIYSSDDYVAFTSSFRTPANDSQYWVDGVVFGSDITIADTGLLFVFPNSNEIGGGHTGPFVLSSDSIRYLYDWDQYHNNDTLVMVRPPFVDGQEYGFFFSALGVADQNSTTGFQIIDNDPNPDNNVAVQRIVWHEGGVGIKDLFPKMPIEKLSVYPNPATDVVNFDFTFKSPSHATAIVRDITGRMVKGRNYGRVLTGTQHYSIDISKLAPGNYTLEFKTDEKRAIAKFTVK